MAGRFFGVPFALSGDRDVTPDALQLDGSVSFTDGFGFDYERPAINPLTGQPDPLYKPIPRAGMNGLFHDITEAVGIIQKQGFADWTADASPYSVDAWVRHSDQVWRSVVNNNTDEPGPTVETWLPAAQDVNLHTWTLVDSGYTAEVGEKLYLNNRISAPTLILPADPESGDEVSVMPYPFTKYSKFPLIVDGNGHMIMGIDEPMNVDEDYAVFICRFIGKAIGWVVERAGRLGASFTVSTSLSAAYGAAPVQIYDATIIQGAPMVMMVHGGGWVAGDKVAANFANGQYVATFPNEYGFSFSSINYTLASPGNYSYPTAVNDVIAAAEHFISIGVPGIVLLGTSAGANVAALAAIARPDLFKAFVGYYGAYDLTKLGEFSVTVQGNIATYTNTPALASPTLTAGSWSLPTVLIHGDADTTVNYQQSVDFGAAIGVTPIILPGVDHSFQVFGPVNQPLPSYAQTVFQLVDEVCIQ